MATALTPQQMQQHTQQLYGYYRPGDDNYNGALAWHMIQVAWEQVVAEKQAEQAATAGTAGMDAGALANNYILKLATTAAAGQHIGFPKMRDEMAAAMMVSRKGGGANPDEFSQEIQERSEQLSVPASELAEKVEEKAERALRGENADMFAQPGEAEEKESFIEKIRAIMKDVYANLGSGPDQDEEKDAKSGVGPGQSRTPIR